MDLFQRIFVNLYFHSKTGHKRSQFGRGQIITVGDWWNPSVNQGDHSTRVLWAGSDPRADGCAQGYQTYSITLLFRFINQKKMIPKVSEGKFLNMKCREQIFVSVYTKLLIQLHIYLVDFINTYTIMKCLISPCS